MAPNMACKASDASNVAERFQYVHKNSPDFPIIMDSTKATKVNSLKVQILHNPRCSKSRTTLQLLEENGVETEVILYLETPPTPHEIKAILKKLGLEPRELMRTGQLEYQQMGLGDEQLSDA